MVVQTRGAGRDSRLAFWPVTLILALLSCGAMLNDYWGARLRLDCRLLYLFLPAAAIVVILLAGSLLQVRPGWSCLPFVGLTVGIVLAIVSGIVLKRAWMSSLSISLCCLWYSFWCAFVALMSISGDWL